MTLLQLVLPIWSPALGMNLIIATKVSYYVRMLDVDLHIAFWSKYRWNCKNFFFNYTCISLNTVNQRSLREIKIKCTIFLADRNILVTVRACVLSRQINEYCNYGDSFPNSNIECYFCKKNACNDKEKVIPLSEWCLGFIAIILPWILT